MGEQQAVDHAGRKSEHFDRPRLETAASACVAKHVKATHDGVGEGATGAAGSP